MTQKITQQDHDLLRMSEEALWQSDTRFDPVYMESVMAADFFEFGRSGRSYKRGEMHFENPQPIDAVIPLPELAIRLLSDDVAQVTYNSAVTFDGRVSHGRRSSIWSRTATGWELRFHQGTPYVEDES